MINPDEDKYKLYEELDYLITPVSLTSLSSLGTLIPRSGPTTKPGPEIVGNHGIWKCYINVQLLLKLSASHDPPLANIMFCLPIRKKKKIVDAPTFQALASDRRCYRQSKRHTGRAAQTVGRITASLFSNGTSSKKWPHGQKVKKLNVTKLKNQMTAWTSPLVTHEQ